MAAYDDMQAFLNKLNDDKEQEELAFRATLKKGDFKLCDEDDDVEIIANLMTLSRGSARARVDTLKERTGDEDDHEVIDMDMSLESAKDAEDLTHQQDWIEEDKVLVSMMGGTGNYAKFQQSETMFGGKCEHSTYLLVKEEPRYRDL